MPRCPERPDIFFPNKSYYRMYKYQLAAVTSFAWWERIASRGFVLAPHSLDRPILSVTRIMPDIWYDYCALFSFSFHLNHHSIHILRHRSISIGVALLGLFFYVLIKNGITIYIILITWFIDFYEIASFHVTEGWWEQRREAASGSNRGRRYWKSQVMSAPSRLISV